MDEMLKMSEEALTRYFTTLSKFGYKKYSDVDKVLVFLFIEELLTGELSYYITEDDYKHIINFLYCLLGSTCLIDFPVFEDYSNLIHPVNKPFVPRTAEDSILRSTQSNNFRVET